jgi:ABC-type sugar transport system ATPase subunit
MSVPTIKAQRLSKRFGIVQALRDVSLSIPPGHIRAVCGENGAGKSTLVKLLMGIIQPDDGVILVDGVEQQIRGAKRAQALGLGLVAQELSLAPHLSILDNIWLGHIDTPFFYCRTALRERARDALQALGIGDWDLDRSVRELAIGQQQLVEIARLLVRNAQVLILDEPTAALSDGEIVRIFEVLKALKAQGRSIIYITHRLGEVFELCDSVTVLRNGETVGTYGKTELDRERLIELMLGRPFADMYPAVASQPDADNGLVVENLTIAGAVSDFSFAAPRGKILCLAGQVGSGANQITRAIGGLVDNVRGNMRVDGRPAAFGSVAQAVARNIVFLSEDRARDGLFQQMTVLDNLVATRLPAHSRLGVLSWKSLRHVASDLAGRVALDTQRLSSEASTLSGGNQQKVLFGRALDRAGEAVLLLNEPTRGIDVGARAEIYKLMRQLCAQGYALIMATTEIEEVVGMGDIVVTLYRGRKVGTYERANVSMPQIVRDITHPMQAAT